MGSDSVVGASREGASIAEADAIKSWNDSQPCHARRIEAVQFKPKAWSGWGMVCTSRLPFRQILILMDGHCGSIASTRAQHSTTLTTTEGWSNSEAGGLSQERQRAATSD